MCVVTVLFGYVCVRVGLVISPKDYYGTRYQSKFIIFPVMRFKNKEVELKFCLF